MMLRISMISRRCSLTAAGVMLTSLLSSQVQAHGAGHDHLQHARAAEERHFFPEAEQHLAQALDDNPHNAQAWLALASLETVRGDLGEARRACARAAAYFDAVVGLACRGRIALAGGIDQREALTSLKRLLAHPTVRERSDVHALWAAGVAAELAAAVGDVERAQLLFTRALSGDPAVHLQAAYLDFLIDQNRPLEVLEWVDPREKELALKLRRVLALKALDRLVEAQRPASELDTTFREWMAHGDFTHGREMAMFYLFVMPDPERAQLAATRNLAVQSEKEDLLLYRQATQRASD